MAYRIAADLIVATHAAFVLFVVLGGFLAWRWRRLVWLHLPALAWGVWIELSGGICPLTPLENVLRRQAGEIGYSGGFVEHYVAPVLYPPGLTRGTQLGLALLLVALNALAYGVWLARRSRRT
jgi:hypothetical protein